MNIGIYIYENAEVLDFSGPFEVFSVAKRLAATHWNIFLVAETMDPVTARGGYQVLPRYCYHDHPPIDLLMVVGGTHEPEMYNRATQSWLTHVAASATHVTSVCTGVFLLAEAKLLTNQFVTSHWEDIPDLIYRYPDLNVIDNKRWVKDGKFITSGGVSAGIDMSLYLVSTLHSENLAEHVAQQMEYRWDPTPHRH